MISIDTIHIDDGKYTVVIGSDNGEWTFKALRYGEDWIEDLTYLDASNMIMSMAYEIQKLKNELRDFGYEFEK